MIFSADTVHKGQGGQLTPALVEVGYRCNRHCHGTGFHFSNCLNTTAFSIYLTSQVQYSTLRGGGWCLWRPIWPLMRLSKSVEAKSM